METADIPLSAIDLDPLNPNEMSDETMDALREEMRRGFLQPVVVQRGDDDRYRMVDGEHRYLIVQEEGFESIPAVIIGGDEDEGHIRMLTTNRLRGQLVPIKVAFMLADLAMRIPEGELRRRLGMDEAEYEDTLRLTSFTDDVSDRIRSDVQREAKEAPRSMTFVVNDRDAKVIGRCVERAREGRLDMGQALAKICRVWEKVDKDQG